jgi:nicotinamide phosphoribosyltransferase
MQPTPKFLLTDSYKLCHPLVYLPAGRRVAYAEFRKGFEGDVEDQRIVFYGLREQVRKHLSEPWTMEDLEGTKKCLATHMAGYTPFPFPEDLLRRVITERGGWFPIRIWALPEASVVYPHVPVYVMEAEGEAWSGLVTFLESILTMTWYPSCVATLSRRCKDLIGTAFEASVDEADMWMLESRLHDFGLRGCCTVEQSIIGGTAHLLNFVGTDTLPAAFHVQTNLNAGEPVATSIPATEHSVMMSFPDDEAAMRAAIEAFGDEVAYSIVMDSYDYVGALQTALPAIAKFKTERGKGVLVLRPDSGDPVAMSLAGLEAADRVFGHRLNGKGYRVITGAALIFGDGINKATISTILDATLAAGYSAQNLVFGMGGNLLQKVNRDTMSFATKLCYYETLDEDGNVVGRDVAKLPRTDASKFSLPGRFSVRLDPTGSHPVVYPAGVQADGEELLELLELIYDCGPVPAKQDSFTAIRTRLGAAWTRAPRKAAVLSPPMLARIASYQASRQPQE